MSLPVGCIREHASSTVPASFLECNGAAISRSTYASLFSAIGTKWGYGDNSTTFNIPDLRGIFPRGWDHTAGNDPDRASRTASATGGATGDNVGSHQDTAIVAHTHTLANQGSGNTVNGGGSGTDTYVTIFSSAYGGNETRPCNKYFMYIIRYQ